MDYCVAQWLDFTITADLDVSARAVIAQLPAFRLVITRKLSCQLELFKDVFVDHAISSNFPPEYSAEEILKHHNARGNAEKAIEELKYGFTLAKLPCSEPAANAAYAQSCVLAYNLISLFKKFTLPSDWATYRIKNFRFRLLCAAALVVKHARNTIIKLHRDFTFFNVFERARWAVLSPALTGG